MTTIRYRGNTYTGRVIGEPIHRYGETFYIVACDDWKVEKCLHASHIKQNVA